MPIDRGVVDQQLQALGESPRWWEQRELRDLPSILQADERILTLSRGKIARPRWLRRSWLIVVTDRRLLCLRSARNARWSQLEIGGSLIARVTLRIGPFRGRVLVRAGDHTYRFLTPRTDAYKLFRALSAFVPATKDALTGFRPSLMVRRVIDHVLALPAAALGPHAQEAQSPGPARDPAVEEYIEELEGKLDKLQNQVDFLEQLLHQPHGQPASGRKLPPD